MTEKIRIKDIAQMAGVSVGTVDRVLHNRPNVSKIAFEKVEKALKEMDYQPNVYASALAYNKSYTFYLIIPKHESEAYWDEIEQGAKKAIEIRRDFYIETEILYYERFSPDSFRIVCNQCLSSNPDGVVIVPSTLDDTRAFTNQLHQKKIHFVMLDSYMPELKPLSFFGQDSFKSGYFSARMLMLLAKDDKQVATMKRVKDGEVTSKQQENREVGFKHYMNEHFPEIEIVNMELPLSASGKEYDNILEHFFTDHQDIHHCITFGSKAHIIGDFLLRTNRSDIHIVGYDMVEKNANCLRLGSISFLVCQHAFQQGYSCIDTLFKVVVLKKKVDPINYMPIELLTKENMDFYRRTQL